MSSLLREVERCMRKRNITASRFGREVASDPRLVFDMRRGREPRPDTAARVMAFIAAAAPLEARR